MTTIKLTAKRQATLPQKLCKEMHLEPGDAIGVERRILQGKAVWCLQPIIEPDHPAGSAERRCLKNR
jgi:bifunctional DNA-binding transcriptional regulator/antitoxin component of YhaV-PrlF toxin-antitoxin module